MLTAISSFTCYSHIIIREHNLELDHQRVYLTPLLLLFQILYNACQLGVFESLHRMRKPVTSEDLADNMQVHAINLEKLLNACVPLGLLNKTREIVNGVEKGSIPSMVVSRDSCSTACHPLK